MEGNNKVSEVIESHIMAYVSVIRHKTFTFYSRLKNIRVYSHISVAYNVIWNCDNNIHYTTSFLFYEKHCCCSSLECNKIAVIIYLLFVVLNVLQNKHLSQMQNIKFANINQENASLLHSSFGNLQGLASLIIYVVVVVFISFLSPYKVCLYIVLQVQNSPSSCHAHFLKLLLFFLHTNKT